MSCISWGSRVERTECEVAAVSVSAVSGTLCAENVRALMWWQVGLGPTLRPGILGSDGRAAVKTRAAAVRSRVIVSVAERMMCSVIGAETYPAVHGVLFIMKLEITCLKNQSTGKLYAEL